MMRLFFIGFMFAAVVSSVSGFFRMLSVYVFVRYRGVVGVSKSSEGSAADFAAVLTVNCTGVALFFVVTDRIIS